MIFAVSILMISIPLTEAFIVRVISINLDTDSTMSSSFNPIMVPSSSTQYSK